MAALERSSDAVPACGRLPVLLAEDLTGRGHVTRFVGTHRRLHTIVPLIGDAMNPHEIARRDFLAGAAGLMAAMARGGCASFQVARDLSGGWTVGETRPWERTVNVPPALSVQMRGKATLKRITRLAGRRAAEFDYGASGEGEYSGMRLRMSLSGQYWVDLATGFVLESKTTAPGQFAQAGEAVQMELKEERTLNRPDSPGF